MIDFPNNPTVGQVFVSGSDEWIYDGTKWTGSGSGGGGGGIPEAPLDGQQYGRQSAAWTVTATAGGGPFLPLSGGTLTGPLLLAADPSTSTGAATKNYVDNLFAAGGGGSFLPLIGGTMTGPIISVTGDAINGAAGTARSLYGRTVGVNRWELRLGSATAEGTGTGPYLHSAGSDFSIAAYDDSGTALGNFNINRASQRMTINGVGAPGHSIVTYPPDVGSATIVLNRVGSGHNCGIVASSGGFNRWALALSDATPELLGNVGSNFSISGIADDGVTGLGVLDINRMSSRMTLNGVGAAVHSLTTYPPDVGSSTMVLNRLGSGHNCGIVASSGGLNRWAINLSDTNPEGSGNNGSDFDITSFANNGTTALNSLNINRANGRLTLNGNGATPRSITTYPPVSGNANLVLNCGPTVPNSNAALIGAQNGLNRWGMELGDGSTEGGGQTGSAFLLESFTDAGVLNEVVVSCARNTGVVTFYHPISNPSDRTLKENIAPLEDALDKVLALQGVSFNMIATPDISEIGLIAQDVEEVVPEVVREYEHCSTPGKSELKLSVDYPKLTALLIEAVKALSARVVALEGAQAR